MPRNTKGYFYQGGWWARVIYHDENGKRFVAQREAKSEVGAKKELARLLRKIQHKRVQRIGSGTVGRDKNWYGRFDYTDSTGKRRTVRVRARTKTDAEDKLAEKLATLKRHGSRPLEASQMTFDDLADHYEEHYLEPDGDDDEAPFGFRSVSARKSYLKALRDYFGAMRLREIDDNHIEKFKSKRLRTPIVTPKQKLTKRRTVASVNRELSFMRRLLNIARRQKWIVEVPSFKDRKHNPLISIADETKRQLFLSREQEQRLLDVCEGEAERLKQKGKGSYYDRLRQIIICAIDTGMRRGEILKLTWADVDLENRVIAVDAHNTKTGTRREVPISERLAVELQRLFQDSTGDPDELCFGRRDTVKKSFDKARKKAGLPEVRFHDLRHTHASRLVSMGVQQAEVGRILGHTQPSTTYRYSNVNLETVNRARAVVNAFNEQQQESGERELVN